MKHVMQRVFPIIDKNQSNEAFVKQLVDEWVKGAYHYFGVGYQNDKKNQHRNVILQFVTLNHDEMQLVLALLNDIGQHLNKDPKKNREALQSLMALTEKIFPEK